MKRNYYESLILYPMVTRSLCALTVCALPVVVSAQVDPNPNFAHPNIIWITCEDLSPNLGCYGDYTPKTPNIDLLARGSIRYNYAFTTAGISGPSRSAIITGMYPHAIGTQHTCTQSDIPCKKPDAADATKQANRRQTPDATPVYSPVIPDNVKCFPELLRRIGYYTTNNEKTDYQFEVPVTVWDENGPSASYRTRPKNKPFFAVYHLQATSESQLVPGKANLTVDPQSVTVPPYYPDTKTVRENIARAYSNIETLDNQVGEIIQQLIDDGVYENSYIFFFSDNGGPLPWQKREILDRGTHIPLLVHIPGGLQAGTVNNDLVSTVDFAPTVLSMAGAGIPVYLQGQAFLGGQKNKAVRKYVYAGRDRIGEKNDRVRMVRDQQYEYIHNFMPERPGYMDISARVERVPMMKEMLEMKEQGKLPDNTAVWFNSPRPVEELYDLKTDPYEQHNLATDPAYSATLEKFKTEFNDWQNKVPDMSALRETDMVRKWWNGRDTAPKTAKPVIINTREGIALTCATRGACIGYRIIKKGGSEPKIKRVVASYDRSWASGEVKNGDSIAVAPSWQIYKSGEIPLNAGDKIIIEAKRIGYRSSYLEYTQPSDIKAAKSILPKIKIN